MPGLKLKTAWRDGRMGGVLLLKRPTDLAMSTSSVARILAHLLAHLGLASQPLPRAPAVRLDLFEAV